MGEKASGKGKGLQEPLWGEIGNSATGNFLNSIPGDLEKVYAGSELVADVISCVYLQSKGTEILIFAGVPVPSGRE